MGGMAGMTQGIGPLKRYDKHRSHVSGESRSKRLIQRVEIYRDFREWKARNLPQNRREKEMDKRLWDKIRKIAIKEVCPLSNRPSTVYEIGMVKTLTSFGYRLCKELYHDQISTR